MPEYTSEEIDWLDDARRKQAELDEARAERDRLAAELAAAARGETPPGTEQSAEAGGTEQSAETPAVPSYEDLKAQVDAISLDQTPDRFVEALSAVPGATPTRPGVTPPEQLTGEELSLAMVKAEQDAAGDRDSYYRAIAEIPGAVDTRAPGGGQRVL
jgi:hypothetical protein